MKKFAIFGAVISGLAFTGAFLFYCLCLNHVEMNEVGIAYNSIGGKTWIQDRPGWYRTSPFVKATTISTLPFRVEITSTAVVINAKIVRFRPTQEGIDTFIRLQGFKYFTNTDVQAIMIGYAFAPHPETYPFLEIGQQANTETMTTRPLTSPIHAPVDAFVP